MVKSLEFIKKTNVFDSLEGCYANGKGIKNISKTRPKSMTNRYKFHARKKNTKQMNNHPTHKKKKNEQLEATQRQNMPK